MKRLIVLGLSLSTLFFCFSCTKKEVSQFEFEIANIQATSLLGEPLTVPNRSPESTAKLVANLESAQEAFDSDPSEMNTIWLGRRYAYLSGYEEAVGIFSEGLKKFPKSYKLYRHRGHRNISLRQFDKAIADYEMAYELMPKDTLEIEPDGAPNKLNIPLSNTQFNVLYHYGLAHYLKGEYEKAEGIYRELIDNYCDNLDLYIATADWLYMTLRRQNKNNEAAIVLKNTITDWRVLSTADELLDIANAKMIEKILGYKTQVVENDSYLKRLRFYNGEIESEILMKSNGDDFTLSLATQGYGMGNWYLYQGDTAKANEIFQKVVEGTSWAAFGYIASEADFARLR